MAVLATAQEIIDQALAELGLPSSTIGATTAGIQTAVQALAILNGLGDDCVKVHDWQDLEKTATMTGDGVVTEFEMPADFGRVVNQTQWASNLRRPMLGPLTAQQWGWTQYGIVSVGVYYRYRILSNNFAVYPVPAAGEVFNFYYISKNWVMESDGVTLKDKITSGDDTPLFDRSLMVAGVKLRVWAIKGFDTTQLASEFNYRLEAEKGQNQGAMTINLSNQPDYHLIDITNVPDGYWNP